MAQHPDYFTQLLKGLSADTSNNIDGPYLAKIIKLDKTKAIADVQPLIHIDKKKQAIVHNCRFIILPSHYEYIADKDKVFDHEFKPYKPKLKYEVGDAVLMIVLKNDDDDYQGKAEEYNASTDRIHDIDASYIVGKIATAEDFLK